MRAQSLVQFQMELRPDELVIEVLWRRDGSQASTIMIRKQVWTGGPVFHLYDNADPSNACTPDSGCRVNPYDKPYLSLGAALVHASALVALALAGGQWFQLKDIERSVRNPLGYLATQATALSFCAFWKEMSLPHKRLMGISLIVDNEPSLFRSYQERM